MTPNVVIHTGKHNPSIARAGHSGIVEATRTLSHGGARTALEGAIGESGPPERNPGYSDVLTILDAPFTSETAKTTVAVPRPGTVLAKA